MRNFNFKGGTARQGQVPQETSEQFFKKLNFQQTWITDRADESMIAFADTAGKYMADNKLTNSKIRSIYGEIKRIQMGGYEDNVPSFLLLRPKVAYALGRDKNNKGLQLFKLVFDAAAKSVTKKEEFQNFCNFIEAILAYHRANGGNDLP